MAYLTIGSLWLAWMYTHGILRGPPFNIQGGAGVFVAGKLFISTGLGGALKISHIITCLYRTVFEVNYLFHAESARNYLFQKKLQRPPPLEIEWWPPNSYLIMRIVKRVYFTYLISTPLLESSQNSLPSFKIIFQTKYILHRYSNWKMYLDIIWSNFSESSILNSLPTSINNFFFSVVYNSWRQH